MALVFNGVTIPDNSANALTFNGSDVTQVVFNGTTVWQQSLFLDTQTVTVGYSQGGQYNPAVYGYSTFNSTGSVSDGTSNLYGGAAILGLYWLSYNLLYFRVSGNRANSGWSTMAISGQTFNRVDAVYSYSSSNNQTQWMWNGVTTNPYTPTGANIGVEFN